MGAHGTCYIYQYTHTRTYTLRYISSSFTEKALDCRKCRLMLSWSSQLLSSWAHLFMDRSVPRETYGYHGWPSDCTVTTLPASWKRSGSCIVWFLIHWRLWFASLKEDYNIFGIGFGIVLGLFGTSQTMNSLRWFGPKMLKFQNSLTAAWWGDHRRPSWATAPGGSSYTTTMSAMSAKGDTSLASTNLSTKKKRKTPTWNQYWILK